MCHISFVNYFLMLFFFFKQKTAYEMRISDWSSDVCSSDLDLLGACRSRRHDEQAGVLIPGTGQPVRRERRRQAAPDDEPEVASPGARDEARVGRCGDRKRGVEGKSVSVRVDLGGRRIIKNKQQV